MSPVKDPPGSSASHDQPIEHTRCRVCEGPLHPVVSLGKLFPSDFPNAAQTVAHPAVPLDLMRCMSPRCGLVQLGHTTPKEWLYGGTYWYRSGVNETMRAELLNVVQEAVKRVELPYGATVVDIGANDGTLLAAYKEVCAPSQRLMRVAFEPAASHYQALRPHATVLFPEYFHAQLAWGPDTKAKIITAVAMFYDLDDPHAFVRDLTKVLHKDGVVVIQQAYLLSMLASTDLTNICHEHLEYYHLKPLERLLEAHGLEVVDVEHREINGGSFRVYVQFKGRGKVNPRVGLFRAEEERMLSGPLQDFLFQHFHDRTVQIRTQLRAVMHAYKSAGASVDLYAASTKANTLLQWAGLDHRWIRQAWERTPEKFGRFVGVTGIPIVSEEAGREDPPAALLIGAWQFRKAFLQREQDYLAKGGRLIFPLPFVESVEQGMVVTEGEGAKL